MTEQDIFIEIAKASPQLTLAEIMWKLDFENETYPNLCDHLLKLGIAQTKADYSKAFASVRRQKAISAALGSVPHTTRDLIEALLDTAGFSIDANSANPMTWVCPISGRRRRFEQDVLMDFALDRNRNLLSNQFKKQDIIGEVEFLGRHQRETIRAAILKKITQPNASFDWEGLVSTCFDTRNVRAEIIIAVLQKFIWQVKRRLAEEPVTHHLLPVVYGSQGCGKSIFVEKMLTVLGSLFTRGDFGRLSDNRESDLFKNYVIFLDEMQKADRSEMDTVKTVITRDTFSYRPMGSNSSVQTVQNSTFIGTTNKLLQQLINDPTGNRRFFQLDFNSNSGATEWAYVNALDFTAMWCSVDHMAADPCLPFFEEMAAINKESINHSTVGQFITHIVENEGVCDVTHETMPEATMKKERLYEFYRDFCADMKIGKPFEPQSFYTELKRLADQEPDFPFKQHRTAKFNGWLYVGPRAEEPVRFKHLLAGARQ